MAFWAPRSISNVNFGVCRVLMRSAILPCKNPAEFCNPTSDSRSSFSSPRTLIMTLASRMSGLTLMPSTVTSPTRGSRNSVNMALATTSRIASAAFSCRREGKGSKRETGGNGWTQSAEPRPR